MAEGLESLPPIQETLTEFQASGFSLASPGCCGHLGRAPTSRWMVDLSFSLSLPPFLPPSAFQTKIKISASIFFWKRCMTCKI